MNINKLILRGYKRFNLNSFNSLEIDFSTPLQLILGTNGCGKSSLLEQLTPLCPSPADFKKDGYKEIHITHHNRKYVMKYVFSPKRHFGFEVDGVELNDGGTSTVHNELVKTHFGITNEIQQLLLSKEKFTSMSAVRRKEWFLQLSDVDFDYAIKLYNKLREASRDVSGAVKLAKKALVAESEKLIGDEQLNSFKKEADSLHAILDQLFEIKKPVEADTDMLLIEQTQLDAQIYKTATLLEKIFEQIKHAPYSKEDYEKSIVKTRELIVANNAILGKLADEHSLVKSKVNILKAAEEKSIDALKQECAELESKIKQHENSCFYKQDVLNASALKNLFETLKVNILNIINELAANPDGKYSSEKLQSAKAQLQQLNVKKAELIGTTSKLDTAIKHANEHKDNPDVTCPKCLHTFSTKYDPKQVAGLQSSLDKLTKELSEVNTKFEQTQNYIEECSVYGQLWRSLINITSSAPALSMYWEYLLSDDIKEDPKSCFKWLNKISDDLEHKTNIEALKQLFNDRATLLRSMQSVGSESLQTLLLRLYELDTQVNHITSQIKQQDNELNIYQKELNTLKQYESLRAEISSLIKNKMNLAKEARENLRRHSVNQLIKNLQSHLATVEQKIGSAAHQKAVIDNITKQINSLVKQEECYDLLIKELSPTEGLIAEGLFSFIDGFISQVNAIIKTVWSYKLEIDACAVSDGESIDLDYKFPMRINGSSEDIPDISKGSEGMIQIVDLAYKVTAMRRLGLSDMPLVLDELGSAMDVQHKAETVNVIRALVEQKVFPQVFFISHDFVQYGALSNCEILLLNDINVVAPKADNVNKHVTFN